MTTVEHVPGCPRTPALVMTLEEAGIDYLDVPRPDGSIFTEEGTMGPVLVDGLHRVVGLESAMRHVARTRAPWLVPPGREAEVDQVLELFSGQLRPTAAVARRGMAEARRIFALGLARLERCVGAGPFLLGDAASLADLMAVTLPRLAEVLSEPLEAWVARVQARPAWARVEARTGVA